MKWVKKNRESPDGREQVLDLTPAELDQKLSGPEQVRLARLIQDLPDEPVSMIWRSDLNERLVLVAANQKRRRRMAWIWRPALGFGIASILAVAFVLNSGGSRPAPGVPTPSVEAALVNAHREAVTADDVAGSGLTANEVGQDAEAGSVGGGVVDDLDSEGS